MTEMEDAKYIDLIAKYLSGNIEPGEKQELLAWVDASDANRAYFDEMIQLWGISENYESHFEADLQTAWQSLNRKLPKAEADIENNGKVIRFPMWLRVAASVVLLLGLGYWWYVNPAADPGRLVEIQTAEGETQNIILPDGSTVWLNENTTFSYMDKFEVRQVNLNGEAFFQVDRQEENPFIILSGEATTTVLGTSFNVRAYPDEPAVEVTVESGKVALKKNLPAEAEEIILAAGESGVYDTQEKNVGGVEEKIITSDSWKTRMMQ